MNYLVVLVAGVILSASLGNCLECYTCNSTSDRCEGKKVKCTVEDQCHLGIWKTAGATIYNAGCMSLAACNKLPAYDDALGSQKCCNTDLCNASDRVKSSLLLFPTLVSVWFAIFM